MKDSWLNTNGEIIECDDSHNKFAIEFLEEEMGVQKMRDFMEENYIQYPYEVLHFMGWVRIKFNTSYLPRIEILGDCIDLTEPMRNTMDPAMNMKQLKIAKELCEKYNTDFHMAINDKRFW